MHPTRLRLPLCMLMFTSAVGATTLAAGADKTARLPNVTIPFADQRGIENWEADGNKGLWIQARDRHWYYARFFAPCSGLAFHESLGFKFGPAGELDRWSEVYTRDSGHCSFTSLVASDGPPPKPKKIAKPAATPAAPAAASPPAAPAPGG